MEMRFNFCFFLLPASLPKLRWRGVRSVFVQEVYVAAAELQGGARLFRLLRLVEPTKDGKGEWGRTFCMITIVVVLVE